MQLIVDFVLLAFSIFMFAVTFTYQVVNIESGGGGAFWPRILLGAMIILELINIPVTIKKLKRGELKREEDPELVNPQNLYISIAAMAVYIFVMKYLGFFVSTVLYSCYMMYVLKVKLVRNIIISVVSNYAMAYIFVVLLMVPLPQGVSIFGTISMLLGI
jgi:hypothetical protein